MKCQKCNAEIPEGKIYCENCGTAIQIVPDYNPVDDIAIGTEEKKAEKPSEQKEEPQEIRRPWYYGWRYGIAAALLIAAGVVAFQISYYSTVESEETADTEPKMILLEKPVFSAAPGTYNYSPRLTISHPQQKAGFIFYTTDGTTPSESSHIYDGPIEIGEGKTVIRALFVRVDGVQSEEADGTYEVIFDYPAEPVFSVKSGDYPGPFTVSITGEAGCRIYYTTNGEEPDRYSNLYQGEITVNPGLTVLQAIAIDPEGGESGIVEAIYNVQENSLPEGALPGENPSATEVIP